VIVATDVAARASRGSDKPLVLYDLLTIPGLCAPHRPTAGRRDRKGISFACEYGAYVMPELEKF